MTQSEIKSKRLELEQAIHKKTLELKVSPAYLKKVSLEKELNELRNVCNHPKLVISPCNGYDCADCGVVLYGEYSAEALSGELEKRLI